MKDPAWMTELELVAELTAAADALEKIAKHRMKFSAESYDASMARLLAIEVEMTKRGILTKKA